MRILFIIDQVDYPRAVNPVLARRVCAELAQRGHTVELLELWDGATALPPAPHGTARHALAFPDEALMNELLEHGRAGTSRLLRAVRLLPHPAAALAAVRQLILHCPHRQAACRDWLEKHDVYDCVLAVGAPYYGAFALQQARIRAHKAVWMMDPYSTNREYQAPGGAAREIQMGAAMQRIFVAELMLPDYRQGPLAVLRPKVKPLDFPCLVAGETVPAAPHAETRLVFCGSLYPEIRTPWRLLELMEQLPDYVSLTMAGGGWEHFDPEKVDVFRQRLGGRLRILGLVPPEQARAEQARADVLVNLGNTTVNLLPSKIFEYFGTGKPVLQLAARRDDPANEYFARYPLALVLNKEDDAGRLADWLPAVRGKSLPFEEVTGMFRQNTPAAVAEALLAGLSECAI